MTTKTDMGNWLSTFTLNQWVIDKQLEGLTHTDSLLTMPFRANSLNWVLGHIVEHRDWMLRALDETTLMPAREVDLYRRGSDILQPDDAVQFSQLVTYLTQSRDCIVAKMQAVSTDFLEEKPQTGVLFESHKEKTRYERLQGLLWHETYHVGQLEFLRQLAGKDDAVL